MNPLKPVLKTMTAVFVVSMITLITLVALGYNYELLENDPEFFDVVYEHMSDLQLIYNLSEEGEDRKEAGVIAYRNFLYDLERSLNYNLGLPDTINQIENIVVSIGYVESNLDTIAEGHERVNTGSLDVISISSQNIVWQIDKVDILSLSTSLLGQNGFDSRFNIEGREIATIGITMFNEEPIQSGVTYNGSPLYCQSYRVIKFNKNPENGELRQIEDSVHSLIVDSSSVNSEVRFRGGINSGLLNYQYLTSGEMLSSENLLIRERSISEDVLWGNIVVDPLGECVLDELISSENLSILDGTGTTDIGIGDFGEFGNAD